MSRWAEDRRKDKAAEREQARADRQLAAEINLQQRQLDRQTELQKAKLRFDQARKDRAEKRSTREARSKKLRAWLGEEAPAAIVMGAPMLLAWTAMAAYGQQIFGPLGVILPLFSEAAMVWFALAVRRAVKANPPRPVGWLRVGLVVFAGVAAAMNFVHGIAGEHGSWDRGVVMAMVSVGGVVVHQLITAGPRTATRSRVQRVQARTARRAQRRVAAIQRASVNQAHAELAADGTVRLVYRAGVVTLQRHGWLRRVRVIEALPVVPDPAIAPAPAAEPAPEPVVPPAVPTVVPAVVPGLVPASEPSGSRLSDEVESWLAAQVEPGGSHLSGTAETPGTTTDTPTGSGPAGNRERGPRANQSGNRPGNPGTASAGTSEADLLERAKTAIRDGQLPAQPSKRDVQRVMQVRAEVALRIAKALKDDGGGAVPATV